MRLLITLFLLAFAQLFFNVAQASPHQPVNADQHKIDKKSARDDDRRKRRQVKTTVKKSRIPVIQKLKLKKKAPQEAVALHIPASQRKKAVVKYYAKHHKDKNDQLAAVAVSRDISRKGKTYKIVRTTMRHDMLRKGKMDKFAVSAVDRSPIKMSKVHKERYQKARETAMNKLMGQLGKPYQWGGTSPYTGFDCSGLVWYAYKDLVKFKIPRTANEMYHLQDAASINRESLEKGDLVFFRINHRGAADHVGVYLGNGKFIQSPRTGKDIQISQLSENYWQRHYVGARRVMTPKTIR